VLRHSETVPVKDVDKISPETYPECVHLADVAGASRIIISKERQ
jgi:hypothetical protein